MRLVYGFLCDYATPGAGMKPTVVGIFDAVFPQPDGEFLVPPCCLHAQFDAPGSGPKRLLTIKFVDEDAKTLFENDMTLNLAPGANGLGMGGKLYFGLPAIQLPGPGDYSFVLYADGVRFGEIPIHVVAARPVVTA